MIGSPEKPLSVFGYMVFVSYWKAQVARVLNDRFAHGLSATMTLQDLAKKSGLQEGDVFTALKEMDIVKMKQIKDGGWLIEKNELVDVISRQKIDLDYSRK